MIPASRSFAPAAVPALALLLSIGAAVAAETIERHRVSGTTLALERLGAKGPAIVFVSGMGEDTASWRAVAEPLSRCARVVLYDRPGIGRSGAHRRKRVMASQAAGDLAALLSRARIAPPYLLVGHSLGGLYVQAFARARPRAVSAIVLVDASSPLEPPGVFVSTMPPKPGSAAAAENDGFAPSLAAFKSAPPLSDVPVLVLIAADHGDTPEREALWRTTQQRTASLVRQGRAEIVERAGHFIQTDQPAVVLDGILATAERAGLAMTGCRS